MPRKIDENSNEPQPEIGPQAAVPSDPPREVGEELLEQLRQAMERHADWESKQVHFSQIQDQLMEKLDDLAELKNLTQIQVDAREQMAGLQTALTLAYQKHFQLEADLEHLRVQLASELNAKNILQQQLDDSERERKSLGGERNRIADEREELKRQVEELRQARPSPPAQDHPPAATVAADSNASTVPAARARADTIVNAPATGQESADESNSNTAGWEEQKRLLFSKYALDGEGENDSPSATEPAAGQAIEADAEDPFDVIRLNVSEIDTPAECAPPESAESVVESIPQVAAGSYQSVEHDEDQRKTEIELSLERARISRQRKELEEKIIAMQMSMSDSQNKKSDGKKTFLTRMTQFLKRDEQETGRESRIDNMMKIFDAVQDKQVARSQSQYRDPRDQPFAVPEGYSESLSPGEDAETKTIRDQPVSNDVDPGLAQPNPEVETDVETDVDDAAINEAAQPPLGDGQEVAEVAEQAGQSSTEEDGSVSASQPSTEPEKPALESKPRKRKKRTRRK